MKRVLAWVVSIVLLLSLCPMSAFAEREIIDIYVNDTFVYDFQRGEDGTFDSFLCQIVTVFSDDSEEYEDRTVYANGQTECNYGALVCSDTQSQSPWQAGNTYSVTYGDNKTFDVEVRNAPIERIEFDDCSCCLYDEESEKYTYRPSYTVYYKDGYSETTNSSLIYVEMPDGTEEGFAVEFTDTQDSESWQLGETYEVTGSALGVTDTFNVTVISPTSVTANDIEIIEGSGNWADEWDVENDTWIEDAWMFYDIEPQCINVTLSDGTTVSGDRWDIEELLGIWIEYDSDQSYENPWGVGEHTATIYAGNVSSTFTVTIAENPVQSIAADDIEIIEGSGNWQDEWDVENDTWIEDAWMFYDIEPQCINVTLSDGTTVSGNRWEIDQQLGIWIEYESDQSYENPWSVGAHTATIKFNDISSTYTVTIVENPIQSIATDDIEIVESNGSWRDEWDEETDECIENAWIEYDIEPENVTVTLKDGSTVSGDRWEIEEKTGIWLWCDSDQSWTNPWGVGAHTATIYFGSVSTNYTVTIVESPIQSIAADDIEIIMGNGSWQDEWDEVNGEYVEKAWMEYDVAPHNVTVTLKDGSTISGSVDHINSVLGSDLSYTSDQSWTNPWGVGEHTATICIGKFSATYTVAIVENPIQSIAADDIEVIEGNGSWQEGWMEYDIVPHNVTVTLKDGSTVSGGLDYIGYKLGIQLWCDSDQSYENPWSVGEHTATIYFNDISATYTVKVVPSPIERIVFEDLVLYEGLDISYDDYFSASPKIKQVVLKDGSNATITEDGYSILYNGGWYAPGDNSFALQDEQAWTAGNTYQVTGSLWNVSATYNVTIKAYPIQSVQVIRNPDKTEYLAGERINLKGLVIRCKYIDGTQEDFSFEDDFLAENIRFVRSAKLNRADHLWSGYSFTEVGKHKVELSLFGKDFEFPVTVKANPITSISIQKNADKFITITVQKADHSTYDMKLLEIQVSPTGDEDGYGVYLLTDKGQFSGYFYTDQTASFALALQNGDGERIKSNYLPTCDFIIVQDVADYLYSFLEIDSRLMRGDKALKFDGTITKDNIDSLIRLAGNLDRLWFDDDRVTIAPDDTRLVSGEELREVFARHFSGTNLELSLSEHYNAQTDTYKCENLGAWGGADFKFTPHKISFSDGVWSITVAASVDAPRGKDVLKAKLNDRFQITSLAINVHEHQYSEYKYNYDATTKKDGTKTRSCIECGHTQTVTAAGTKLKSTFSDIKPKAFYYAPIQWAVATGITKGVSKTNFAPDEECTRAQIATFLWRAAGSPAVKKGTKNPFKDISTKDYYYNAVLWAVGKGITTGTSKTTFGPGESCTRAQVATFLYRAEGSPSVKGTKNPFKDVGGKAYYYSAVLWAVKNGITTGTSKTTFGPSETCTRGQIATFLYRNYN